MRYQKIKKRIYEKYLVKVQWLIDVLNSCKTPEHVEVCNSWARGLFKSWKKYESSNAYKKYDRYDRMISFYVVCALDELEDMFKLSSDRKKDELSKNEKK